MSSPAARIRMLALLVAVAGCASSTAPDLPAVAPGTAELSGSISAQAATHTAGTLSTVLNLSGRPHGVAIAPTGRFCVSQIDANTISCGLLSATGATLGRPIQVGWTPAHVALNGDGTVAFTADQSGATSTIVSTTTAQLLKSVPLSDGGFNVLANPPTRRVYVTTAGGVVHVIDMLTGNVLTTVQVGAGVNGLALDATHGVLYVSSLYAGTITAINTATNTVRRTYQVSAMPQRIALSLDNRTLYIASETAGLEALNVETGTRFDYPNIQPGSVGLALSPDGQQLYVTNPPAGRVYIMDVHTGIASIVDAFWRPRNVAFGLGGAAALITDEYDHVWVFR